MDMMEEKECYDYLANRDYLTGVFNRRYMGERLKEEHGRFIRNKNTFCVGIFDIDNFKKVK